jgi:hypothetical protein
MGNISAQKGLRLFLESSQPSCLYIEGSFAKPKCRSATGKIVKVARVKKRARILARREASAIAPALAMVRPYHKLTDAGRGY